MSRGIKTVSKVGNTVFLPKIHHFVAELGFGANKFVQKVEFFVCCCCCSLLNADYYSLPNPQIEKFQKCWQHNFQNCWLIRKCLKYIFKNRIGKYWRQFALQFWSLFFLHTYYFEFHDTQSRTFCNVNQLYNCIVSIM